MCLGPTENRTHCMPTFRCIHLYFTCLAPCVTPENTCKWCKFCHKLPLHTWRHPRLLLIHSNVNIQPYFWSGEKCISERISCKKLVAPNECQEESFVLVKHPSGFWMNIYWIFFFCHIVKTKVFCFNPIRKHITRGKIKRKIFKVKMMWNRHIKMYHCH